VRRVAHHLQAETKNNRTTSKQKKGLVMNKVHNMIKLSALALFALLVPTSLMAGPIIVRISDLRYPNPPEIEVDGAPNGWNFCTCDINTPGVEDGGIITLFGVDTYGSINEPCEGDWRFSDPGLPSPADGCHNGVDIVWIQHDFYGPFNNGDLQIAFNSAFPGHFYNNPALCPRPCSVGLGPLTYKWQVVYADATVVVLFKAQK
jgi:hypothetical protein